MFSHITIGNSDAGQASAFYDPVLGKLGLRRTCTAENYAAYQSADNPTMFWLLPPLNGKSGDPGKGPHAAFLAPNRQAVGHFQRCALSHGGTEADPQGPRPQYHEHYYPTYVRDPDSNKLQACRHHQG